MPETPLLIAWIYGRSRLLLGYENLLEASIEYSRARGRKRIILETNTRQLHLKPKRIVVACQLSSQIVKSSIRLQALFSRAPASVELVR